MTPAEFAQKLVDWVSTVTQLDPEKGELPNVDDWRRNAEKLFALHGAPPTAPARSRAWRALAPCVCGLDKTQHLHRACEGFRPVGGRVCPGCSVRTYRADGIAHCLDCEPAKEPAPSPMVTYRREESERRWRSK